MKTTYFVLFAVAALAAVKADTTTVFSPENMEMLWKKVQDFATMKDSKFNMDEWKKTVDNMVKQFNETVKVMNSPDTQVKVQKMQETCKKLTEQFNEVLRSLGIAVSPNIQKSMNEMYDEVQKFMSKMQEKSNQIINDLPNEMKKKKLTT